MARPKIVLLGMLTKMPVAGVTWLVAQYVIGLRRLGFDVHYVEAHARTPSMLMRHEDDDATARAVEFLATEMGKIGLADRWAFHALHDDGACHGMSWDALKQLYADAALIVNMHGGTVPMDEHAATGRLVFLGTDPGEIEFEIARGDVRAIGVLEMHSAFFTWGLNYGNPDCKLPWSSRFVFAPSPPPVVLDLWTGSEDDERDVMTTVGNWRQPWRNVVVDGVTYRWSKHHEFLKILELPGRVDQRFELALASYEAADEALLVSHGWTVRPAADVSTDTTSYRRYITTSRGEFTVAKDQNVRLRSGWFSERSACYLGAGRPVVMQDTGFGSFLGEGRGLLSFRDLEGAAAAIESLQADYTGHRRAAREIAREHLDADVVLRSLLDRCGVDVPVRRTAARRRGEWTDALDLTPTARRPLRLRPETVEHIRSRPVPNSTAAAGEAPLVSIVMVTHDEHTVTRMAVESVLAHTPEPFELIVIDNASSPAARQYLEVVASRNRQVRFVANVNNRGFARAVNQGLRRARGEVVVIANNDIVVTPGWSDRLVAHLTAPGIGAVGPVTNRCGNEAEVSTTYRTYGEMLAFAEELAGARVGECTVLPMLVMFCAAIRRDVLELVGPLDERFGIGMFEDDDYAMRLAAAGLRVACAEDVFVHHFGEASFSRLYEDGRRSRQFELNRARFEEKWGVTWEPHGQRSSESYERVVATVRDVVSDLLARRGSVAVVSKGDERLVRTEAGSAWHFPAASDGSYAGYYPKDDADAARQLEQLERRGLTQFVVPGPATWWLDRYPALRTRLAARYRQLPASRDEVTVFELTEPVAVVRPCPSSTAAPPRHPTLTTSNTRGRT